LIAVSIYSAGLIISIVAGTRLTIPVAITVSATTGQVALTRAVAIARRTAFRCPMAIRVFAVNQHVAVVIPSVETVLLSLITTPIAGALIPVGVMGTVIGIAVVAETTGIAIFVAEARTTAGRHIAVGG